MRAGRLPLDEQMACLRAALDLNRTLGEVLSAAAAMNLPGWYLVAGCLYQTVWNVVTGQPPEAGILDYDLAYFDASDLSWEAEDAVIQAGREVFAGLGAAGADPQPGPRAPVVRAEVRCPVPAARLQPRRPSTPSRPPPPASACACSAADGGGSTPRTDSSDVFNLVTRPNPVLATARGLRSQDRAVDRAVARPYRASLARDDRPVGRPTRADPQERPRSGDDPQPGPSGCGAVAHASTTGQPFSAV